MRTQLDDLAVQLVGDGKDPNLFFVTDINEVVAIYRDADLAYTHWRRLSVHRQESALEDRKCGCLASVEPREDQDGKPRPGFDVVDNFNFLRRLGQ